MSIRENKLDITKDINSDNSALTTGFISPADCTNTVHEDKSSVTADNADVERVVIKTEPVAMTYEISGADNFSSTTEKGDYVSPSNYESNNENEASLNSSTGEFDASPKKKPNISCNICDESFSSNYAFKRHMASHKYTCVVCDKKFKNRLLYDGHMRDHAGEKTPYWCDHCEKKFATSITLQKHHRRHATKERRECSICGTVFSRIENYKSHMEIHADPDRNKCGVCGKQYSSKRFLKKHMLIHQEEKPYHCVVCDRGFNYEVTLKYHMKSHKGETVKKPHKCEICEMSFATKVGYTNHMNIHTGMKPFACGVCGKTFAQLTTKQGHELTHAFPSNRKISMESVEDRTKNISLAQDCPKCLLSFTTRWFLHHHLLTNHKLTPGEIDSTDKYFFPCGICDFRCENQNKLNSHMIERHCHENTVSNFAKTGSIKSVPRNSPKSAKVTKLNCNICEKKITIDAVRKHMLNHGQKRYVCRICGVTFYQTANMTRHMRIHTGETPYVCKLCGKRFRTTESFKKHKDTHTDKTPQEKRYKCDTCGRMYLDNYHLKRHTLTHMKKYKCATCKVNFYDVDIYRKHTLTHTH